MSMHWRTGLIVSLAIVGSAQAGLPSWSQTKNGYPSQEIVERLSAAAHITSKLPENSVRIVEHGGLAPAWTKAMWTGTYRGNRFQVVSIWCWDAGQGCEPGSITVRRTQFSQSHSAKIVSMLSSERLNHEWVSVGLPFIGDAPSKTIIARWHGNRWWAIRTDLGSKDMINQLANAIVQENR
jgi:hypothetical protein